MSMTLEHGLESGHPFGPDEVIRRERRRGRAGPFPVGGEREG